MKISATWSSSRIATRVSWALEEMIISLVMPEAPGQPRRLERAKYHEQIQPERDQHARESLLLGKHREDEVIVCDRKKTQLALRPLREPFSPRAAGSHGDPRLNLLVPRALGVLRGIEKCRNALTLIILEREFPRDRRHQHPDEGEDAEDPHRHAGDVGNRERHRDQRHGRPEVRLACN